MTQLLHFFVNIIGYIHSIGLGLLAHEGQHAGLTIGAGEGVLILPIVQNISHFTNKHRTTIMIGYNNLFYIIHGVILGQGTHSHFHCLAAGLATGGVVVILIDDITHSLVGNTIFLQLFRLQHDANTALAGAHYGNLGYALHHLELVLNIILDNTTNLATRTGARGKGPGHDGTSVQVNCLRSRLINIIG